MEDDAQYAGKFPLVGDAVRSACHGDDVVPMPAAEYNQRADTAYLFKSHANMRRLMDAYELALAGEFYEHPIEFDLPSGENAHGQVVRLVWTEQAWEDYNFWRSESSTVFGHVNELIKAACENPDEGPGEPVAHRYGLTRAWSRHISDIHRLVHLIESDEEMGTADLIMLQVRYHR